MNEAKNTDELLNFFKALSDGNRLKIIGLLAQRCYTVEQLAAVLNLSASTTSHHLARLSQAGLVEARADGHYYLYSLKIDQLHAMAQRLLVVDGVSCLSQNVDLDAYERKVLKSFIDEEGRITAFPSQEKKLLVLLRYVVKAFEPNRRYNEKQVHEILARYHDDTAFLRRHLILNKLMSREGGGGEYWRLSEDSLPAANP